jgi:hypothetical protein
MITLWVSFLSLATLASGLESQRLREQQERAYLVRQEALFQTELLGVGSDRLTSAVRGFAATGDRRYYDEFQYELHHERTRDRAVERLTRLGLTAYELDLLGRAKGNSDALVALEDQAFASVRAGRLPQAVSLVFGDEYREAKRGIMEPLAQCRASVQQRLSQDAEVLAQRSRWFSLLELTLLTLNSVSMVGALLLFYRPRVVEPLARINRSLNALLQGQRGVTIGYQQEQSEVGEIARSIERYRLASEEAARQRWLKNQLAEIAQVLHQTTSEQHFAEGLLGRLVPHLNGGYAALYVSDEGSTRLRWAGGYAVATPDPLPGFEPGEGLVGQCCRERRLMLISDLPPGYLQIQSGVGGMQPRFLVLVPVLSQAGVVAVLEIAMLENLNDLQKQLLEAVSELVALHLEILQRNLKTQKLLEELQGYREAASVPGGHS